MVCNADNGRRLLVGLGCGLYDQTDGCSDAGKATTNAQMAPSGFLRAIELKKSKVTKDTKQDWGTYNSWSSSAPSRCFVHS
jgi:hypothetical protein